MAAGKFLILAFFYGNHCSASAATIVELVRGQEVEFLRRTQSTAFKLTVTRTWRFELSVFYPT